MDSSSEKSDYRMKITTKKGDAGFTSLLDPKKRISKSDIRSEINGTLDQAGAVLGLARASSNATSINRLVLRIQEELFLVCSEVAASPDDVKKLDHRIRSRHVRRLEKGMDSIEKKMPMPRNFVVAGANHLVQAINTDTAGLVGAAGQAAAAHQVF